MVARDREARQLVSAGECAPGHCEDGGDDRDDPGHAEAPPQ
jgi:hypothetical protein